MAEHLPEYHDFPEFYKTLDGDQKPAADHTGSHSVLFAGPGTGKTRTIKGKVVSLVKKQGIPPKRIIALAFTRVAANQLKNDITNALKDGLGGLDPILDDEGGEPLVSTIHGFALRQIVKNGDKIDAVPSPVRVSNDFFDRRVVIEDLTALMSTNVKDVKAQFELLSAAWDKNFSTDGVVAAITERNPAFLSHWHDHRNVFGYTLRAEMVYQVKQALEMDPSFELEDEFLQLIVDEFQDLNACELALVKALSERNVEVTVAGDDDQSIYGFRHATPQGIRDFLTTYPGGREFTLRVCHRCQKNILNLAHFVIQQDTKRKDKGTVPKDGGDPGEVQLHAYADQEAEAKGIAEMIAALRQPDGEFTKKILILLRTNHNGKYSKPIVKALTEAGIKVEEEAGPRPLETESGLLLRALLELVLDPNDSMAWRVALQLQKGNQVGEKALRSAYDYCVAQKLRFAAGLEQIAANKDLVDQGSRLASAVNEIRAKLAEFTAGEANLDLILDRTLGYVTDDSAIRGALEEDLTVQRYGLGGDPLPALLRSIAVSSVERSGAGLEPGVHILTMHSAKGLSAEVVFIPVAEDHSLPGFGKDAAEELELRRLFFVAITRAIERVVFTMAKKRTGPQGNFGTGAPVYPKITPFLKDSGYRIIQH